MTGVLQRALQGWRRRWWRPAPAQLAAYDGLKPMVIVTGGSEGIGLELARQFAAAGNDLLLIARRPGPLDAAAAGIRASYGVEAIAASVDITSPGAIAVIDAALAGRRAYCDVLVNSAGIGLSGFFHEQREDELLALIDLNVRALTQLTRHYLAGMRVRGRGGVLSLASLGGYTPGPYQAAYYASKAYVISLSEAIAAETAGEGVRITVVAPGPVNTGFHARMGAEGAFYRRFVLPAGPQSVAYAAYQGFTLGLRLVVPGLINPLLAVAMRIMPHRILIPIVGLLLKPRGNRGHARR